MGMKQRGNLRADTWVEDRDGNEYRVEFEITPGRPAKLNAMPEDCYPEEPPEVAACTVSGPVEVGTWKCPAKPVAVGEDDARTWMASVGASFDDVFDGLSWEPDWLEYERED